MSSHFRPYHLARIALRSAGRLGPRFALRPPRAPLSMTRIASPFSTSMAYSSASIDLEPSLAVEEETVHGYKAEHYYPVQIGHVFNDRYHVVGKIGYGSASTVWLCHDLRDEKGKQYVALKVYINCSRMHRELPIYTHINNIHSQHGGRMNLRRLLDSFEIDGPNGKHYCLVHEALGMNLEELRDLVPGREFTSDLVRESLRDILRALHFLREEAHVIHRSATVSPFYQRFLTTRGQI
jgi:serine/threonine-protein kinase SRPK3